MLLARVLAAVWTDPIRELVWKGLMGSSEFSNDTAVRGRMLPCVLAALERLLQTACEQEEATPQLSLGQRPRSATASSYTPLTVTSLSSINGAGRTSSFTALSDVTAMTPTDDSGPEPQDELSPLLDNIIQAFSTCQGFRKIFTSKRIESIIPPLTDFISLSASPTSVTPIIMDQRNKVKAFLETINDDASRLPTLIRSQVSVL